MSDDTEPKRQPAFDDAVDGLDCFASEGVDVVDSADDVGSLFEASPMLPAMHNAAMHQAALQHAAMPRVRSSDEEWQQWTRDRSIRRALVATMLLVVGMLSVWLMESSKQPETIVASTPPPASTPGAPPRAPAAAFSTRAASSTPAAPPVAAAVPAPPVARVIKPSSPTTTRSVAARSVVPQTVPPRRAPTLIARSSPPAPSVEPARPIAPPAEEPAVIEATPETVRAESAAAAPAAPPVAAIAVPTDRTSIEQVLQAYRDAYDRLDAPAAAMIWPRVDTRALNRAFNSLAEQDVSFERCDLDIAGRKANARCTGEIRYVRRVGDQNPRVRRLSWSFAFERVSDRWQIAQVTAD